MICITICWYYLTIHPLQPAWLRKMMMHKEGIGMDNALWSGAQFLILATVVILGIVFIWVTRREVRSGFPLNDERTSRINGKAALKAYYVGYFFMAAELLWQIIGNEFLHLPQPDGGYLLLAAMLVLGLSFAAFKWYYGREGDAL